MYYWLAPLFTQKIAAGFFIDSHSFPIYRRSWIKTKWNLKEMERKQKKRSTAGGSEKSSETIGRTRLYREMISRKVKFQGTLCVEQTVVWSRPLLSPRTRYRNELTHKKGGSARWDEDVPKWQYVVTVPDKKALLFWWSKFHVFV